MAYEDFYGVCSPLGIFQLRILSIGPMAVIMIEMNSKTKILIAGIIGALLGVIGAKVLFVGSISTLLPWGLIGLATGIYAKNKNEAIVNGGVYGFLLSFIFMITGYNGPRSVITLLPPFILFGLFGLICGLVLGLTGYFIGIKLKAKKL